MSTAASSGPNAVFSMAKMPALWPHTSLNEAKRAQTCTKLLQGRKPGPPSPASGDLRRVPAEIRLVLSCNITRQDESDKTKRIKMKRRIRRIALSPYGARQLDFILNRPVFSKPASPLRRDDEVTFGEHDDLLDAAATGTAYLLVRPEREEPRVQGRRARVHAAVGARALRQTRCGPVRNEARKGVSRHDALRQPGS